MQVLLRSVLAAALAVASFHGAAAKPVRRQDDLASQIETQNEISLEGVLSNMGPYGDEAPGAWKGIGAP